MTPESVGLTWGIVWALAGVVVATNVGVWFALQVEAFTAKRKAVVPPWSQQKNSLAELALYALPFVIGVLAAWALSDALGRKWMFIGGTVGATAHLIARIGKVIAAKVLQQRLGVVLPPEVGGAPSEPNEAKKE